MGNIITVPYEDNILNTILDDFIKDANFSDYLFIFTNKRPIIYFKYLMSKKLKGIYFIPKLYSFSEWVDELFMEYCKYSYYTTLTEYDELYIIYLAAKDILGIDKTGTFSKFYPWALELSKIFRELDMEVISPYDILYPPEEAISMLSQEIMSRLETIYERVNYYLTKNTCITSAKKLRFLAENFSIPHDYPRAIFVGFFALSKGESLLLKKFYDRGDIFYWHISVASEKSLPTIYKRWLKEWRIEFDSLDIRPSFSNFKRRICIFEAHDVHSEIEELAKRIEVGEITSLETAIILPDSKNLIPLLYALSNYELNVTMGYPFYLTSIYTLFSSLFEVLYKKDKVKGIDRDLVIKFLREADTLTAGYLKPLIEKLLSIPEKYLSKKLISLLSDIEDYHIFLDKFLFSLEEYSSLNELSKIIFELIKFLDERGSLTPIEKAVCLWINSKILPVIESLFFSSEKMSIFSLTTLFLKMCAQINIPFEGEPLKGIQIMGLLESRSLTFKKVYILDANEGILPGTSLPSPLLPQQIRKILGLPHREKEEAIYEFHFHRLIYSAQEVHLFYHTKQSSDFSLKNTARIKSRYIERIIWNIERDKNMLLEEIVSINDDDFPIFSHSKVDLSPSILTNDKEKYLFKKENFKDKILKVISRITPSILSLYISCPLKFFYSKILELDYTKEKKDFDYAFFGEIVHRALKKYFAELSGKDGYVSRDRLSLDRLYEILTIELSTSPLIKNMSSKKISMLLSITRYRLEKYLNNHPEFTSILYLEKPINYIISVDSKNIVLEGRIDRVDRRDDLYIVLDYKTGYVNQLKKSLFDIEIPYEFDRDGLENISTIIGDIQLLSYIFLFGNAEYIPFSKITGALVELFKDGREKFWIHPKEIHKYYNDLIPFFFDKFPSLLRYIILHMIEGPIFPILSSHCGWCSYRRICSFYQ